MKAALSLMVLSLCGCYSVDPYSFQYVDVPDNSRILAPATSNRESALVTVRHQPSRSFNPTWFTMDGQKIVELRRGEQYSFAVNPGQHLFGSMCQSLVNVARNETMQMAEAGKRYAFRIYESSEDTCLISPMMP